MGARTYPGSVAVLGTGVAFPGPAISNGRLARLIGGVSDRSTGDFVGSLAGKMGVESRFLCRDFADTLETPRAGDTNPELAARAVAAALDDAGVAIEDLDVLIGHTTTPHTLLPPSISWAADHLGFAGHYMELRQACTGFANALVVANGLLQSGAARRVAIVGSETGSVFFDVREAARERSHLVSAAQMGDGAGAVLLGPLEGRDGPRIDRIYFGNNGAGKDSAFSLSPGSSSQPFEAQAPIRGFHNNYGLARECGAELFQRGFEVLTGLGVDPAATRYFVPHQANGLMPMILSPLLGLAPEKIHNTAVRFGNTGSAATWIGLHCLRNEQALAPGELVGVLGAEATKFLYGGFVYTEGGRRHRPRDGRADG